METRRFFTILVLGLGLMVWSASVASGAQSLFVNGQPASSIKLELGQSCTVAVISTDGTSYIDYLGFDYGKVLGTFSHLETKPAAGNGADVVEVNQPAFYGYGVRADGTFPPPSPGVHFVFEYVAQQIGETDLKLYQNNPPPSPGPRLDLIHIIVTPPQHLRVNGQEVPSITLELGRSCTVEVVSTISTSYADYVGFDNSRVLGSFSHLWTRPTAGDHASVTEYNDPTFYGYRVVAAGLSPPPSAGIHFIFEYVAQELGTTYVKLYNSTFTKVLDSVRIVVIPLRPKPIGTAITYQGRLIDANEVADGLYDLQFKLYDNADPVFAAQQGSTIDINDLDVIDGYFTVELDFGSGIFDGDARWLETAVRPGDSNDVYTTLSPRTELTPTPYALYAETAGGDGDWTISGSNMYTDAVVTGNVGIGTTSPSAKLDVAGNITSSGKVTGKGGLEVMVPKGAIIMWGGTIDENGNPVVDGIPDTDWHICDGTGGTPDLRNRFIVGAGSSYSVNDTGGENTHTLTESEMPRHRHSYSGTTSTIDAHAHGYFDKYDMDWITVFGSITPIGSARIDNRETESRPTAFEGEHSHSYSGNTGYKGENAAHENRPPYYALAYIMRIL